MGQGRMQNGICYAISPNPLMKESISDPARIQPVRRATLRSHRGARPLLTWSLFALPEVDRYRLIDYEPNIKPQACVFQNSSVAWSCAGDGVPCFAEYAN